MRSYFRSFIYCAHQFVVVMALIGASATHTSAQQTYTVKQTTAPPTIDGVYSPGEWDGAPLGGDFTLLREAADTPDAHGITFQALWDNDALYIVVESEYTEWSLDNGIVDEDCAGILNCSMDFNSDNFNLYFDPNTDDETEDDPVDGYQIAFNTRIGESSYDQGINNGSGIFQEAHINSGFGNQGEFGFDGPTPDFSEGAGKWSFVANMKDALDSRGKGGTVEMVFPWETFDAPGGIDPDFEDGVFHPMAPEAGDEWFVNFGYITSDPDNFLPIWNWNPSRSFVTRPDGVFVFSNEQVGGGQPRLEAGDADEDLDFDQFDLIKVQQTAKYLTGQAATWAEGDWDGAPGGSQGSPPAGDGFFNQIDIIASLGAGTYLTGPYAAINAGGEPNDGQTSIIYNPQTGELGVDAPAGVDLTSINIDSAAGIFTGDAAQNLGGSFDNDADNNIFKATFGSSFGSLSFGNIAQTGLSEEFVLGDLSAVGSLAGGGDLGDVDLIYVPEPSTIALLCLGLFALVGYAGRIRR